MKPQILKAQTLKVFGNDNYYIIFNLTFVPIGTFFRRQYHCAEPCRSQGSAPRDLKGLERPSSLPCQPSPGPPRPSYEKGREGEGKVEEGGLRAPPTP